LIQKKIDSKEQNVYINIDTGKMYSFEFTVVRVIFGSR
jgi:hypothetical protein